MSQADLKLHTVLQESRSKHFCLMFTYGQTTKVSQLSCTASPCSSSFPKFKSVAMVKRTGKINHQVRMSVNSSRDGDLS